MAILDIVIAGVAASATCDLCQGALRKFAGLPTTNWRLVGRWIAHMRRGIFVHAAIGEVTPAPHEWALGWAFHYCVGIAYAGFYTVLLDASGWSNSLASASTFGIATIAAPVFILQPALGLGIAARRAVRQPAMLLVTFASHTAFGVGLYLGFGPS